MVLGVDGAAHGGVVSSVLPCRGQGRAPTARSAVGIEVGEGLRGPGAVVAVPPGQVDAEREQGGGGLGGVGGVEVAAAYAFLDDLTHDGVDGAAQSRDLPEVLLGQRGELVVDDSSRRVGARVEEDIGAYGGRDPLGGRGVGAGCVGDRLEDHLVAAHRDRVQELLLGAVVDVDRGRAQSGRSGDVAGAGAVEPLGGECLDRRVEQTGAAAVAARLGAGAEFAHRPSSCRSLLVSDPVSHNISERLDWDRRHRCRDGPETARGP